MKARQKKKQLKHENMMIEEIINERLTEYLDLNFLESHSWKKESVIELRYSIKNYEWWNLIAYINKDEATIRFHLLFLALDKVHAIKEESMIDGFNLGVYEGTEERFEELRDKINRYMKDEVYYIALKYSKKEKLTNAEVEQWYNKFVEAYYA